MKTVALASLPILFFLVGCGDDAQPEGGIDMPVLAADLSGDMPSCMVGTSCGTCGAGTVCADSSGQFNRHTPTCLKTCTTTTDCPTGQLCAVLYSESIAPQAVCVSKAIPAPCGTIEPSYHCDFPPASCLDAQTLFRPFSQAENGVCGHEKIHCASGCVDGVVDGGSQSGHCN